MLKNNGAAPVRTTRFTDAVLARSRLVIVTLIALVALGGLAAFDLAGRVTEANRYPGLASWEANDAIHAEFGTGGYERPTVAVVELPDGTALDDPTVLEGLADASAGITTATGARVVGYADDADPAFVTEQENLTYLMVFPPYAPTGGMPGSALGEVTDLGPTIITALTDALPDGTAVRTTGLDALSQNRDEGGLDVALKVGIAAALALLVLLWFFRSALAAVPLLIALLAMPIAALGIWAISLVTTVHETTLMMAPLLAIGIAVDYALIVTSRWREARTARLGADAAVREAMRTSGRAIVVSALAVATGLATMIVLPIPILASLGLGGTVTAAASALVTLAVLPLLLRSAGRRRTPPRARPSEGRGWERLATWSMRRRIPVIAGAGGLLLALTGVATTINLSTPTTNDLVRQGPAHEALTQLQDAGVPTGVVSAFDVLTPLTAETETTDALVAVDGVAAVVTSPSSKWRSIDYALLTVIPTAEGGSPEGAGAIQRIRDAVSDDVAVGGNAAQQIDYVTATYSAFPWMLALVCLTTFVVVALAFRSMLLALKAIVLNLLSLGAVLGTLVIVWQWGWGTEAVLGVVPDGSIGTFVPVTVFAFLFGLTMDYEVFLLSRIKEEHDRTGSTETAVVRALGRTGRLITAAAVILFFSFASMAMTRELDVAVFASGVALGVLLDVTLIRGLLVPALIAAFGRHNWWFPGTVRKRRTAPERP